MKKFIVILIVLLLMGCNQQRVLTKERYIEIYKAGWNAGYIHREKMCTKSDYEGVNYANR